MTTSQTFADSKLNYSAPQEPVVISSTEEILDDLRQGRMVIIMDDEDRENEGDLLIASQFVTPAVINFMAREGCGLICMTLTREKAEALDLSPMVSNNQTPHMTNFTVSFESRVGIDTGISAFDRATTIQAAVQAHASSADIIKPGHIFGLIAKPNGVLERPGHTEAGCDFTRIAGLQPSATIVEILNQDGTMARAPQLAVFARKHKLKLGTIRDLITYRKIHGV